MERNIYKIGKELFITNDEEIKEGIDQWYLDKVLNEPYNSGGAQYSSKQDVIILTTDQDLIKDGVQAIDDDFLEWFINNPSFERVEVNIEGYPCMSDGSEITFAQPANLGGSEDIRNNIVSYNKQEHTDTKNFVKAYDKKRYKIIIPKEEESNYNGKQEIKWISENQNCKQIDSCYNSLSKKCICPKEEPKQCNNFYEDLKHYFETTPREKVLEDWNKSAEFDKVGPTVEEILKPKQDYKKMSKKFTEILTSIPDDVLIKYTQQETLEEVAENKFGLVDPILGKSDYRIGYERGLIKGAKWQEERSYSEEDMVTFSKYCLQYLFTNKNTDLTIENLFEQFNKR